MMVLIQPDIRSYKAQMFRKSENFSSNIKYN